MNLVGAVDVAELGCGKSACCRNCLRIVWACGKRLFWGQGGSWPSAFERCGHHTVGLNRGPTEETFWTL